MSRDDPTTTPALDIYYVQRQLRHQAASVGPGQGLGILSRSAPAPRGHGSTGILRRRSPPTRSSAPTPPAAAQSLLDDGTVNADEFSSCNLYPDPCSSSTPSSTTHLRLVQEVPPRARSRTSAEPTSQRWSRWSNLDTPEGKAKAQELVLGGIPCLDRPEGRHRGLPSPGTRTGPRFARPLFTLFSTYVSCTGSNVTTAPATAGAFFISIHFTHFMQITVFTHPSAVEPRRDMHARIDEVRGQDQTHRLLVRFLHADNDAKAHLQLHRHPHHHPRRMTKARSCSAPRAASPRSCLETGRCCPGWRLRPRGVP